MKNGEYESTEQMDADLNLMFENAKRYNVPNSNIYKRALRLQQILQVSSTAFSSPSMGLFLLIPSPSVSLFHLVEMGSVQSFVEKKGKCVMFVC